MDSRDLAIGMLTTTAVVLLVGLLVIHAQPNPARASGLTIMHGDYSLAVGTLTERDEELVYIIDAPQQKLNVYRFDNGRKQIDLVQTVSLEEMRNQAGK